MLEIKGKVNTAVCYAKTVEDSAIEQIRRMCDLWADRGQSDKNYARCTYRKRMYDRNYNDCNR